MENDSYWGIDLGGTKVEGAILERVVPVKVRSRLRVATGKEKGYDHIIGQIIRVVELLKEESGEAPERIGIGTPGTLDPITGLMKNSNTTALIDRPLKADLEAALGISVEMANDANCFAIAEARLGVVAREMEAASVVFGSIMGTGVGGGLVVDGKVLNGRQGICGEWGHNFLHESGGACYCGQIGCVETVISGPALEQHYEQLTGNRLAMKQIVASASQDAAAQATLDRLISFFGRGMAQVINILDPDAVVLGGGLGNIPQLYTEGRDAVRAHVFNNRLDTRFLSPALGDSAGVFGAALLVAE